MIASLASFHCHAHAFMPRDDGPVSTTSTTSTSKSLNHSIPPPSFSGCWEFQLLAQYSPGRSLQEGVSPGRSPSRKKSLGSAGCSKSSPLPLIPSLPASQLPHLTLVSPTLQAKPPEPLTLARSPRLRSAFPPEK